MWHEYLIKERELFMARTTKGTQQKRRSKGDGSLFPNKRGGWTVPDIEKNGYRTKSLMLLPKEKRKHY